MATDTYWSTGAGQRKTANKGFSGDRDKVNVAQYKISFAEHAVASGDVVQICTVPAGTRVLGIGWEVTTAEGATCTATLGDGDGANSWDASINLNSAAAGGSVTGTDAYDTGMGKFYAASDTIDLTMGHATDAAIITFQIMYIVCSNT